MSRSPVATPLFARPARLARHATGSRTGRLRALVAAAVGAALVVGGVAGATGSAAAQPSAPPRDDLSGLVALSGAVRAQGAATASDVEDLAAYVPQVSCDPDPKPGTARLGRLLTSTYPGTTYTVSHQCGQDAVASEHADGRAIAWQVSARSSTQRAQAETMVTWLLRSDAQGRPFANARRLGVMYLIWNNRIWDAQHALSGWRPYSTCADHDEVGADTICRRNHLMLSLSWAGAMARTSFWDNTPAATDYGPCRPADLNWAPAYSGPNPNPCPRYPTVSAPTGASAAAAALVRFSGATVGPGDDGPVVAAVQRVLGAAPDGDYGARTADAVAAFQAKYSLPPSGALDAATWRRLLKVYVTAPVATVPLPTPKPKPTPKPTPKSPLTPYKNTVLHYGMSGPGVLALQIALGVRRTAYFGPETRAAVVAFQVAKGLTATGVVDTVTWVALGA